MTTTKFLTIIILYWSKQRKPKWQGKTYMYITSNISRTSLFRLSSKVAMRLFLALNFGSGYFTICRGASNSKSPASNKYREKEREIERFGIWGKAIEKGGWSGELTRSEFVLCAWKIGIGAARGGENPVEEEGMVEGAAWNGAKCRIAIRKKSQLTWAEAS